MRSSWTSCLRFSMSMSILGIVWVDGGTLLFRGAGMFVDVRLGSLGLSELFIYVLYLLFQVSEFAVEFLVLC